MNGTFDNAYVLRRVQALLRAHSAYHHVGPTLLDYLKQIEELTASLPENQTELEALTFFSQVLAIEQKINHLITVAEVSHRLAQTRFEQAWSKRST